MTHVAAAIPHDNAVLLKHIMTRCAYTDHSTTDIIDVLSDIHTHVFIHGFEKHDVETLLIEVSEVVTDIPYYPERGDSAEGQQLLYDLFRYLDGLYHPTQPRTLEALAIRDVQRIIDVSYINHRTLLLTGETSE